MWVWARDVRARAAKKRRGAVRAGLHGSSACEGVRWIDRTSRHSNVTGAAAAWLGLSHYVRSRRAPLPRKTPALTSARRRGGPITSTYTPEVFARRGLPGSGVAHLPVSGRNLRTAYVRLGLRASDPTALARPQYTRRVSRRRTAPDGEVWSPGKSQRADQSDGRGASSTAVAGCRDGRTLGLEETLEAYPIAILSVVNAHQRRASVRRERLAGCDERGVGRTSELSVVIALLDKQYDTSLWRCFASFRTHFCETG